MVLRVKTALSPEDLLDRIQSVEEEGGRVREETWGPRTIDIDLLLFGELTVNTQRLTVPHPGIKAGRSFVIIPLTELAPGLTLPDETQLTAIYSDLSNREGFREIVRVAGANELHL